MVRFYRDLLSETFPNRSVAIRKITRCFPRLVSTDHNDGLMRPITLEEVEQAVMEMPMSKSSGPNEFTTDFFHHCWPIVKEEVWGLEEESCCIKGVLPTLNATFITLIPKRRECLKP